MDVTFSWIDINAMIFSHLFDLMSQHHMTLEISTYGSEFVEPRIATKVALESDYMFRSLGVAWHAVALMLGKPQVDFD
jgi:hypothetical protein